MIPGNQFPKTIRLRNKSDYDYVFKNAKRINHQKLLILYRKNDYAYPRMGVIVGKKSVRRAVGRNRIKRITRQSFRLASTTLKNVDIIVLARKGVDKMSNEELFICLEQKWKKLQKAFCEPASSVC